MNYIVKAIGTIVMTFIILGLPVLVCLSFVFEWNFVFRVMLSMSVALDAILIFTEVYERSEE